MAYSVLPIAGVDLVNTTQTNPNSAGTAVPVFGPLGAETFGSDENELLLVEENETTTTGKADKLSLARQLIQHISKRIPS